MRTRSAGVTRLDSVDGGRATIATVAAVRTELKPRWHTPRGPNVPSRQNVVVRELADAVEGVSLQTNPLLWFTFRTAGTLDAQYAVMARFASEFYGRGKATRFAMSTPDAPRFKNVAILLQPRFEFGPKPTVLTRADATASPPVAEVLQTIGAATLEVQVRDGGGASSIATPTAPAVRAVSMRPADVGLWLMRYVLQLSAGFPGVLDDMPIRSSDLSALPPKLSSMLQKASGKDPATMAWPTGIVQAYS